MKYIFTPTSAFKKSAKRLKKKYKSLPKDIAEFLRNFQQNPSIGVDLGSGFRKIRMEISSKNKGKSGGARIITYELYVKEVENTTDILLVEIYDKSEKESIGEKRINQIVQSYLNDFLDR